ncbi:MAG TPA: methyltransferase domain-containing protein [Archangium sp.]
MSAGSELVDDGPTIEELVSLARSPSLQDRAFANGALRIRYARFPHDREVTRAAYAQARAAASGFHAAMRLAIREGTLRGDALRRLIPDEDADAWVEELLDLAHPPLDETPLPNDHTPFIVSGVAEILFAIDRAQLRPEDTFVDLGAGTGKVVLLAHLLTGARAHGIELDETLVREGEAAARSLNLEHVTFDASDARTAALPNARVFYLYSPFSGVVLDEVMARLHRLAQEREFVVCSSPSPLPWLRADPGQCSWCVVHRSAP